MFSLNYYSVFIAVILRNTVAGLYEDQIGKFDWKQDNVGKVKYAAFDTKPEPSILYVVTDENVLAALSVKTGDIIWRKIFETGETGHIHLLHVFPDSGNVITISGNQNIVFRSWNGDRGVINKQWTRYYPSEEKGDIVLWSVGKNALYRTHLGRKTGQIETEFIDWQGNTLDKNNQRMAVGDKLKCAMSATILGCMDEKNLKTVMISTKNSEVVEKPFKITLSDWDKAELRGAPKTSGLGPDTEFVIKSGVNYKVVAVSFDQRDRNESNYYECQSGFKYLDAYHCLAFKPSNRTPRVLTTVHSQFASPSGEQRELEQYAFLYSESEIFGEIQVKAFHCFGGGGGCMAAFSSVDAVFSVVDERDTSSSQWKREEALAGITDVIMVEMPISEEQMRVDNEGSIAVLFLNTITDYLEATRNYFASLLGYASPRTSYNADFVRDGFNLHKIIVVSTKFGRILGIDNKSKKLLWAMTPVNAEAIPSKIPKGESSRVRLFKVGTCMQYPGEKLYGSLVLAILRDKISKNGIIVTFDPVFGHVLREDRLNYKIGLVSPIAKNESTASTPILIVDEDKNLRVYPENEEAWNQFKKLALSYYFYAADPGTSLLKGYAVKLLKDGVDKLEVGQAVPLRNVWRIDVPGEILVLTGKNPAEKVHSRGRVLSDRSVQYKYLNPNLLAIVAKTIDKEDGKEMLNFLLVDGVTGAVINFDYILRAGEPVRLIHSENWIIWSYYSEKYRRTEVASYELYVAHKDGDVEKEFSSYNSVDVTVQNQAYILPAAKLNAMTDTVTERGITAKHILMALSDGWVIETPYYILDAKRPNVATPQSREEGILPYSPEIPILPDAVVNYNQTVAKPRGIHTSPTSLESTCLVFVYGLDLYFTRVAPSKTFDLLKDDFDYYLISIVLGALVAFTFVTKYYASRRTLNQAWK